MKEHPLRSMPWFFAILTLLSATGATAAFAGDEKLKKEEKEVLVVRPGAEWTQFRGELGALSGRGYLGIEVTELTAELLRYFAVNRDEGVLIARLVRGGPADKAGLTVGDVLTTIDGQGVASAWEVRSRVRNKETNEKVSVEIWRRGKAQTIEVAVGEQEHSEIDLSPLFLKRRDGEDVVIELEPGKIERRIEIRDGDDRGGRAPLREIQGREESLQKRLQELEKRIHELERLLEKKD